MSVLPLKDRRYLGERRIAVREVQDGAQKGVVLTDFPLPPGRFQVERADILIMLPPAYPDAPPDMFFAEPHLVLVAEGREPRCTQMRQTFAGRTWQRWSRHSYEWRPGIDGLWTMLKRIETALEAAA